MPRPQTCREVDCMRKRSTVSCVRLLRSTLFCIGLIVSLSCATDPGQATAASPDLRITHSLEQWFTSLARRSLATQPAAEASLDFALLPTSRIAPDEWSRWLADMRPSHPQAQYRIAELRISPAEPPSPKSDEYETRFALERDTVDDAGVAHIARWQQHWRIRLPAAGPPIVLSIHEEPRLIFPGTGPQIVCF